LSPKPVQCMTQPLLRACALAHRSSHEVRLQWMHTMLAAFVHREAVRDHHLRGIPDIQRLSRKLAARKITLQELCQLYMASNQLPALADALSGHEGVRPLSCVRIRCGFQILNPVRGMQHRHLFRRAPPKACQACCTGRSGRQLRKRVTRVAQAASGGLQGGHRRLQA
jgi:hypothetical protein